MKVVLLLCFVTPLIVALHVDQNHYFTLLNVTVFMLNKTNCWICGAQIEHGKQGYPLTTTQFYWDNETSEFNINIRDVCKANFSIEQYRLTLQYPGKGKYCYRRTDKSTFLPGSNTTITIRCKHKTIIIPDKNTTVYQLGHSKCQYELKNCTNASSNHQCVKINQEEISYTVNWTCMNEPTDAWMEDGNVKVNVYDRLQCLNIIDKTQKDIVFQTHLMLKYYECTILPLNLFFICGNNAYRFIPKYFQGTCYLGYVFPRVSYFKHLPTGSFQRHSRKHREVAISNHLIQGTDGIWEDGYVPDQFDVSEGDRLAAIILPMYGPAKAIQMIRKLARIMETTEAIILLNEEQKQLRIVALQNRMALDYLLAEQGGVCALINNTCCTYIPDYSNNITDHINKVKEAVAALRKRPKSMLDGISDSIKGWFNNLFGNLGKWLSDILYSIGTVLLYVMGFFLAIYVCYYCLKICITKLLRYAIKPVSDPRLVPSSSYQHLQDAHMGKPYMPSIVTKGNCDVEPPHGNSRTKTATLSMVRGPSAHYN